MENMLLFKNREGSWEPYVTTFHVNLPDSHLYQHNLIVFNLTVTRDFHRRVYFFDLASRYPMLGIYLEQQVHRFLLLLTRWLFRVCGMKQLHDCSAHNDNKNTVLDWFSTLEWEPSQSARQTIQESEKRVARAAVEIYASKINAFVLRIFPKLHNNAAKRIRTIITEEIKECDPDTKEYAFKRGGILLTILR